MVKKEKIQLSIHPRHWFGRSGQKSNTCGQGMNGKYLRKARERLAVRRLDHAMMLKSLSNAQPPEAFRCPGSMKWR
jgi:hypothetical protein